MIQNKFTFIFCLLVTTTSICHAKPIPYKTYQSKVLNCGEATFQVVSQCYAPNEGVELGSGGLVRESCKSSQLKINWKGQSNTLNFPITTVKQKKILESKGYQFNSFMKQGDWSPMSLACGQSNGVQGYFVIVNQATSNDINQEYLGDGSLAKEPIILNLNGTMTSEALRQKIYPLLKQNKVKISKAVGANAIFGDE